MKLYLKKIIGMIYRKSPLLFRTDASLSHIKQRIINISQKRDGEKCETVKKTGSYEIQSLRALLQFLDKTKSKVYGREIIEGYEENEKKTILLVSHELSLSGAPIVLLYLAESLKRRGFQAILICSQDGEKFSDYAAQKGIPVVFYPELQKSDMISKIRKLFFRIVISTIKCAAVIQQLNATDSSVIWWIHEAGCCYDRESAQEMPHKVTENVHIYAGGSYARKMLVGRFPGYKVKVLTYSVPDLANVLNHSDFHMNLPDKTIFALFGAVCYRKGQDILKDAIEQLPEKVRKECFFLFVGYNSDPKITSAINELSHQYRESVLYIDELKLNDLCQLYHDIDFLICASRDDPMPVTVAYSMSFGKPCICSENTGSAAIINQYQSGCVYRHNSSAALARRIEESFYMNKEDYTVMSKNARCAFEHVFSEQTFEKNLDQVLGADMK